jgi:hypothetical protein
MNIEKPSTYKDAAKVVLWLVSFRSIPFGGPSLCNGYDRSLLNWLRNLGPPSTEIP